MLDLPTLGWGSAYNATTEGYQLSDNLVSILGGSGGGGAVRREPEKGWNSTTFRDVMMTTRIYSDDGVNIRLIETTRKPGVSPNTRKAIIAATIVAATIVAATIVGGIVFISTLAWLLHHFFTARRNTNTLSRSSTTVVEVEDQPKFEPPPDCKKVYEIIGTKCRHEIPATEVIVEADRGNAVTYAVEADGANTVTYAAELPATNVRTAGRWGVPIIRVESKCSLRRADSNGTTTTEDSDSPVSTPETTKDKDMV